MQIKLLQKYFTKKISEAVLCNSLTNAFSKQNEVENQDHNPIDDYNGTLYTELRRFFDDITKNYSDTQSFKTNLQLIQEKASKCFTNLKLITSDELTNFYNFNDFLSHICYCFTVIFDRYNLLSEQSDDQTRSAMSSILIQCIFTQKIKFIELVELCKRAEDSKLQSVFNYYSTQILRIFYNPTEYLKCGLIRTSSYIKTANTQEDLLSRIERKMRPIDTPGESDIFTSSKKLFDDSRIWNLFHTSNACKQIPSLHQDEPLKTQSQVETICSQTSQPQEKDDTEEHTLSIFDQGIFEAYLNGEKTIYEIPIPFQGPLGFIDLKGNVYLNDYFLPKVDETDFPYYRYVFISAFTLCHIDSHLKRVVTKNNCYRPLSSKPPLLGIELGVCHEGGRCHRLQTKGVLNVSEEQAEEVLRNDSDISEILFKLDKDQI